MPPPTRRNPFGVTLPTGPQEPRHRLPPSAYAERLDLLMPPQPDLAADLTFADLFSGIGGFHLALARLGIKCALACDQKPAARKVYSARFGIPDDRFPDNILNHQSFPDISPDVICSGFPCQPWSEGGHGQGLKDDRGGPLIEAMRATILRYRPAAFFLENVDGFGVLKDEDGNIEKYESVFENFLRAFRDDDYITLCHAFESSDFGLPQIRSRVFLIGFDKRRLAGPIAFRFPAPLPDDHPGRIALPEILNGTPYRWSYDAKGGNRHWEMTRAWTLRASGMCGHGVGKPSNRYLHRRNAEIYRIETDRWHAWSKGIEQRWEPSGRHGLRPDIRYDPDPTETENIKDVAINQIPEMLSDQSGIFPVRVEYRELLASERLRLLGFPDGHFDGLGLADSTAYDLTGNSISVPTIYHLAIPMIAQIRAMKPRNEAAS